MHAPNCENEMFVHSAFCVKLTKSYSEVFSIGAAYRAQTRTVSTFVQRTPMSSYKELLAQRERLEKQIEEAKAKEFAEVVNDIKQKMADYGITLADFGFGRGKLAKAVGRPRAGVAPKYRD